MLGSEGDSLGGAVSAVVRHRVRIPGAGGGVESLNVAVAAAIVLAATLGRD
ncbi:MAG: TrmH family RNA methyltransferase [bacterium]